MSNKPRLSELRSRSVAVSPPEDPGPVQPSRLRWWMGWVIGPGLVGGLIVGGGAWFGAHFPDSWFVRLVAWITGG